MHLEDVVRKECADLLSASVIRERETAFKIPVWAFDAEVFSVIPPWVWPFSGDHDPLFLHGHLYVLRFHIGQVNFEQVLFCVFQDVHWWKPICLLTGYLARRYRRQWRQQAIMSAGSYCIHIQFKRSTI